MVNIFRVGPVLNCCVLGPKLLRALPNVVRPIGPAAAKRQPSEAPATLRVAALLFLKWVTT